MRILLLAMPDASHNFFRVMKVPQLGLCSLAAALEGHEVRIADLVLVHRRIGAWLSRLLAEFRPELVGISCMSFQYPSALKTARICRAVDPRVKIVLGGYHPTLQAWEIAGEGECPADFLVRGEGEETLPGLVLLLEAGAEDFSSLPGLSWRRRGEIVHNPAGGLLDLGTVPLPDRQARLLGGFNYFGRKLDCIETSRGCTRPCSFCSISGMYGRSFRTFEFERILADLEGLRRAGTETILIVDDNITLDAPRLKRLCAAIAERGLAGMEYIVQGSVAGIAGEPELAPLMAAANFRLVFLGIESVQVKNLDFLRKGDIRGATAKAVGLLRRHGIAVMGGFIVGNPDDTEEDVREVFRTARRLKVDLPVVQCVTPYPATAIRKPLLESGLVTNPGDLSRYNGFICNVRTRHLDNRRLNRILNRENMKLFFNPGWFRDNHFVRRREKGAFKVLLNNLEFVRGWFTGNQFISRHRF
jgi:anaerobic magnesium-protoporphyrin IX monomethyl ester cyclase